ncbi:MAG: glycosyltransferase family 2 protein [Patescibacteria group bacterium]|nr:glycosyltransferase family 2 protein [Patescibacteria group bacterium]
MSLRNKKSLLTVVVIGYNSKKFLPTCLDSLKRQTLFKKNKLDIIYIDNISHDDSPKFVLENYPFAKVFQNHFNFGYAGAANQGIDLSGTPFISIMNPDIILEPDYYEKILKSMKKKIGSATGKLLKYDFNKKKKTKTIDTTGLKFHRSTRTTDRGQGEKDKGQYDKKRKIWGVSGACPVYRLEALTDVKQGAEYFDKDFFMYKEDVDLAWRMNRKGWKAAYVPKALGYHGRGTGVVRRKGLLSIFLGRKKMSKFQKKHSFRNHRLMLIKNLRFSDLIKHPIAIPYYCTLSAINALREGVLFSSIKDIIKLAPKMLKKR